MCPPQNHVSTTNASRLQDISEELRHLLIYIRF